MAKRPPKRSIKSSTLSRYDNVQVSADIQANGRDSFEVYSRSLHEKGKSSSREIIYMNRTKGDITIGERCGIMQTIPGSPMNTEGVVLVKVITKWMPQHVNLYMGNVSHSDSAEAEELLIAHENRVDNMGKVEFSITYTIPEEDIDTSTGTLYVRQLDINLSKACVQSTAYHPYSDRGEQFATTEAFANRLSTGAMVFGVTIVDSSRGFGARYVNLGDRVFKITPRINFNKRDGIYITTAGEVKNGSDRGAPMDTLVYSFEYANESLKRLLFKTMDEAKHFGNAELQHEYEMKEKDHVLKERDYDLKEQDYIHRINLLEQKGRSDVQKLELTKASEDESRQTATIKNKLDITSASAKSQSDMFKASAVAVTTILGLVGLWVKYKSSQ